MARDAAEQSRLLTLPKPEQYKVELSKDFKIPDGLEFAINQTDPQIALLRAWAAENRISQDQFSKLLDMHAGVQLSTAQTYAAAKNAEIAKLGPSGPGRMDAINTWLKAKGYEPAGAMLVTESIVKTFEKIMADMRSQGASSYTGNGRDNGAGDGKIPGYENMSFAQRRQAQDQQRQQRGAR